MVQGITIAALIAIGAAILYAIYQRQKQLEERGFVEPTKAGGIPFASLQQFIEPSAAHIEHVKEERQHHAQNEAPGDAKPAHLALFLPAPAASTGLDIGLNSPSPVIPTVISSPGRR